MSLKTISTSYIEFFRWTEEGLEMISFRELNAQCPFEKIPGGAEAYRFFEIIDRVDEQGIVVRSLRSNREICYLK